MLKIGLTGSIAVGKTFVAETLINLGCPVLDADRVARAVVEPHTIGWQQIIRAFGSGVLNSDESLNRAKLGTIVFSDGHSREILNQIVHPLVFAAQSEWLEKIALENGKAVAVVDAALMIESGGWQRFDKIVVVWCKPELQLERLIIRNNFSRDEALLRINAQMPQEEKKRYADFLIDSSGGFADTSRQVESLYQTLIQLAQV